MTSLLVPTGRGTRLRVKRQSAFDTQASGNYLPLEFMSETLGEQKAYQDDPRLGRALHNRYDAQRPAPGLVTHGGPLAVPLDLSQIGVWLTMLFGNPTTSGTSPDFTHTFVSGAAQLPSATIEVERAAGNLRKHVGCLANSIQLSTQRAEGWRQAQLQITGRNELDDTASSIAGTVPAMWAEDVMAAAIGEVAVGGTVVGRLLEGSMTYSNNFQPEPYANNSIYVGGYRSSARSFTGSLTIRVTDAGFRSEARAETAHDVEFRFSKSAARQLVFASRIRFEQPRGGIQGADGWQEEYAFRGEQTDAAPMLTVTLKNGRPGTDYTTAF